ncbi:MAG: glycosyl hydrolase-related protein, partial [Chloroflexi bacterium]|nr:glycosyl hydrolase-related protein [Chloroflexota bacterium]
MSLTPEWQRRIDSWRRALRERLYRPLGSISLEGHLTTQHLSYEEAMRRPFAPLAPETPWGAKWEYGWFRGRVVLPEEAKGHRIVLVLETGGESLVYVNGQAVGARDREHREITLTQRASALDTFEIVAESYAGHGPMVMRVGPVPPDRMTVPEPPATQRVLGETTFGIWEEDLYQLLMDVETLARLRNVLDVRSLRVAEIDQGLQDFTLIVDPELPYGEFLATVHSGRERLQPLLATVNGSTVPELFAFGHAHIDVAWLWPLAETERKTARTFSSQLTLLDEYPFYRFMHSTPHLYVKLAEQYPALFERVKQAAQRGQFLVEGGMWVESDTNIPSGESLIRQFLFGKRYFREEFGVECELLWLPDVFGYSGALPQILRGCGINYFSTAKIFWAYNGGEQFPYNTFVWEGIDGSRVLAHFCNDYNSHTDPESIADRWNSRVQLNGISTRLVPFGFGDGGGGPTRDHLEFLRRMGNLEGLPKVHIASPIEFFHDLERRGIPDAHYVGELYFQAHRGTLTSQARTKRGNRKGELALREAELWSSIAASLHQAEYPQSELAEAWRGLLLNQFHDIIPGSSIHRVYEEAEALYQHVLDTAEHLIARAQRAIAAPSERHISVFNSLSWSRTELIPLPGDATGLADPADDLMPVQHVGDQVFVEVTLPPMGLSTFTLVAQDTPIEASPSAVRVTERSLENEYLRAIFNEMGEIISLFDKESQRELLTAPGNVFRLFKDVPTEWDAWDIDSMYELTPVVLQDQSTAPVASPGPLVGILRVVRSLHGSHFVQHIRLRRGSRRLEFETEGEWRERHKLLKVAFSVNVKSHEAWHEVQYGHLTRPTHRSRRFDADRFEVSNQRWTALVEEGHGVAVLNDCKYGVSVLDNCISLTLLKSALGPDMTADIGHQEFTYALYAWNGSFCDSAIVREGYELNCPPLVSLGRGVDASFLSVDATNVIIDTVKRAEDGLGDLIVRLYESKRTATRCRLHTTLPVVEAVETNMLEVIDQNTLQVPERGEIILEFRPFEVKTLRLRLRRA